MREVVEDYYKLNNQSLRKKAILVAINKGLIEKDDEDKKKVFFKNESIKKITYGTIETWAKEIKNNLDLTG